MRGRKKRLKRGPRLNDSVKAEELFSLITETVPGAIVIIAKDGSVSFANSAAEKIFGIKKDKIRNRFYNDPSWKIKSIDGGKFPRSKLAFTRVMKTGKPVYNVEHSIERPGGRLVALSINGAPIKDKKGRTVGMIASISDITERERIRKNLENDRRLAQRYFNVAAVMLVVIGADGRVISINKSGCRGLGYKKECDVVGLNWFDNFVPARMRRDVKKVFNRLMGGKIKPVEYYENSILTKAGEERIIAWHNVLLKDENGKINAVLSSGRDVTDRKNFEEKLKISEEKYRMIFDATNDAVFVHQPGKKGKKPRFMAVNSIACRRYGYTMKEFLKMGPFDISAPDYRKKIHLIYRKLYKTGGAIFEWKHITKKGKIIPMEISARMHYFKGVPTVLSIARDITERKKSEFEIKKLSIAMEQSPVIVMITDIKGVIQYVNKKVLNITGYRENEMLGKPSSMFGGQSKKQMNEMWQALGGAGEWRGEFYNRKKNGERYWELASISPIKDEKGEIISFIKVAEDITHRKAAEEAVRESEEKFRTLSEQAQQGIVIIQDNRVKYANKGMEKMGGRKVDEIMEWTSGDYLKLVHPDSRNVIMKYGAKRLTGDKNPQNYEIKIIAKDGTIRWVAVSAKVINYGGKAAEFVTTTDISGLKETEEKLRNTVEELKRSNADLEQFAYVASHDLQEPLRMVSSYVQFLERRYKNKLDPDADEFIEYAVEGAARMQKLIKDLLAYSRIGIKGSESKDVDLNKVISGVLDDLQETIAVKNAVISCKKLPLIKGDEMQMGQLFMNLINNSLKFIKEDENPRIEVGADEKKWGWTFYVRDNGIGMKKKYLDRIFVIFNRLHGKDEYPGTGIGLAICKKIVERRGGKIWVESKEGKGTTFYFSMPGK